MTEVDGNDKAPPGRDTGNNCRDRTLAEVARRLMAHPFPRNPSEMIALVTETFRDRTRSMAESFARVSEARGPTRAEADRISERLSMFGRTCPGPRMLEADISGETLVFVLCGSGFDDLHGVHIDGDSRAVLSTEDQAYAEMLLWGCQMHLEEVYSGNASARNRTERYCGIAKETFLTGRSPDSMFGMTSLSRFRFDPFRLFIGSVRYEAGLDYIRLNDSERLNTDLRRKKKSTAVLQRTSPLNEVFCKVEFDDSVTPEMSEEMYSELIRLREENWLPDLGGGYTLRLRRYVGRTKGGVYYRDRRNIVVGTENTGVFVHEYMHAYDALSGSSSSLDFMPIAVRYSKIISMKDYKPTYSAYLRRMTEIHSRCYEMYLYRKIGFGPLLRFRPGEDGMDTDPELDRMVDEYFDRMIAEGWRY